MYFVWIIVNFYITICKFFISCCHVKGVWKRIKNLQVIELLRVLLSVTYIRSVIIYKISCWNIIYNKFFSFLLVLSLLHVPCLIPSLAHQNWLSYQFTCLQVLDFLKAKENFIALLLKHLDTSAIMDLLLKLMTQVEGIETRQNILNVSTRRSI